jgi:TPR repeat protein
MMKGGAELMANGDISAARLMYRRGEEGEATAAFALAETSAGAQEIEQQTGITPDVTLARIWYEKAKDVGSTAALERLESLARLPE